MALKIYEYECASCGETFEALVKGYRKKAPCACGGTGQKIISAPTIQTLETHFRGMREEPGDPKWRPGHGEYQDENLTDKKGNPLVYKSLSEKRKLLKERGLYEKGDLPVEKRRRSERPMLFTKEGSKRSQLGLITTK